MNVFFLCICSLLGVFLQAGVPTDQDLSSSHKKLKFFNLDLHISVIADVKDMLEKEGHEVVNWSISGHSWVFGKEKDRVDIVNEKTWKQLDQEMCDKFYERYKEELKDFDAFIVTHNASFALLYEKFNKPILVVNSTRYENPFTGDPVKWKWLNEYLQKGVNKGQIFFVSNNKADQRYLMYYTGIFSELIPNLCLYTHAEYTGNRKGVILHLSHRNFYEVFLDALKNKDWPQNHNIGHPYTWKELYDFSAVVHFPYQISTMSFFEQYSANVPLFFPSKKFLRELHKKFPEVILSQISFFQAEKIHSLLKIGDLNNIQDEDVLTDWIELADYYDSDEFPYVQYFDSFYQLENMLENTEFLLISKQMKKHNEIRKERIRSKWKNVFANIQKACERKDVSKI